VFFGNLLNGKAQFNALSNQSNLLYELSNDEQVLLKKCLLEMYIDVNNVCEKYGLDLLLTGGSALGAVRHNGFIPWDDDLDLAMERKDYNKLLEIFDLELGDKYLLNAPNYKTTAKTRFAKIFKRGTIMLEIGDVGTNFPTNVFLDIFPIENIPDNNVIRKLKGALCNCLMFIGSQVSLYKNKNDILKRFMTQSKEGKYSYYIKNTVGIIFSFLTQKTWFNLIDNVLSASKGKRYCNIPTGRKHYFGEIMERKDYFPPTIGEFEGLKVKLPNNINKALTNLYGDYMQIPSKDKREKHFVIKFSLTQDKQDID
jgi:lipopolysaccharide cholinephosphotransferase